MKNRQICLQLGGETLPWDQQMTKVLVAEDNMHFRRAIVETLSGAIPDLQVEEAASGQETLDKAEKFDPSLIIMDIRLPNASGLDLAHKIKAQHPSTHIAILTSYDLPEYRQRAAELGIVCFFVKGQATPEEILNLVTNYSQC
jgi:two-component system response regulator YesN